jgi:hypothetical protein
MDIAWTLASSAPVLALAWSAQGGGWLLAQLLPLAGRFALDRVVAGRWTRLTALRARTAEEWGMEAEPLEEKTS